MGFVDVFVAHLFFDDADFFLELEGVVEVERVNRGMAGPQGHEAGDGLAVEAAPAAVEIFLAAGPMVLAAADLVTLQLYFSLARWMWG